MQRAWRAGAALLCAAALSLAASATLAGDRPFLATSSAAAEEDDDAVWALESSLQCTRALCALSAAVEYAFDPVNSVQFEYSRVRDRELHANAQGAGLEYKHLFNHIARDGYGFGIVVAAEFAREPGAGWRHDAWSLVLPLSWRFGAPTSLVHTNLGVLKGKGVAREWTAALALEHEVARRTTLFAELAREGDARLLHGGVRHWVRREKFAVDLSLLRSRDNGQRNNGVVLGLGWYDM